MQGHVPERRVGSLHPVNGGERRRLEAAVVLKSSRHLLPDSRGPSANVGPESDFLGYARRADLSRSFPGSCTMASPQAHAGKALLASQIPRVVPPGQDSDPGFELPGDSPVDTLIRALLSVPCTFECHIPLCHAAGIKGERVTPSAFQELLLGGGPCPPGRARRPARSAALSAVIACVQSLA